MRRRCSNRNGFVTTPTVNAPSSFEISAMTGAAPVPVPPPMPAVTKTISAPRKALANISRLSSAAFFPISGFAPAPKPRVSFSPISRRVSAFASFKACASVLTTMNSTPLTPDSIIRLTALHPPPPTPITLILARESDSKSNSNMMAPPNLYGSAFPLRRFGASAHTYANSPVLHEIAQPILNSRKYTDVVRRPNLTARRVDFRRRRAQPCTRSVSNRSNAIDERRVAHTEKFWNGDTNRRLQLLTGQIGSRRCRHHTSVEHISGWQIIRIAHLFNLFLHERKYLLHARFNNRCQVVLSILGFLVTTHPRHAERLVLRSLGNHRTSMP